MLAPATGVKRRWISVVDESGQDIDSADVDDISSVEQVRLWAKRHCAEVFPGVTASELSVYADRAAFEDKIPLRHFKVDDDLGIDEDKPMLVEARLGREVLADGVSTNSPHLKRPKLVKEIFESLQERRFVIFSSPPESGKTSVINLFAKKYSQYYKCIVISFFETAASASQALTCSLHPSGTNAAACPVILDSVKIFNRSKFLLDVKESKLFLSLQWDQRLLKNECLVDLVVEDCNGLAGALQAIMDALRTEFKKRRPTIHAVMALYYASYDCLCRLHICFAHYHLRQDAREPLKFLTRVITNNRNKHQTNYMKFQQAAKDRFAALEEVGVLFKTTENHVHFTSILAQRHSLWSIAPSRSTLQPSPLLDLVKRVVQGMSTSALKGAVPDKDKFPVEATFQHLFMHGILANTPVDWSVCPELSSVFPFANDAAGQKIKGAIDFFVHGRSRDGEDRRWGIELLVKGKRIREHNARLTGKYAPLQMTDHVLVDLRDTPDGRAARIMLVDKKATVFIKARDYSQCTFLYVENKSIHTEELMVLQI